MTRLGKYVVGAAGLVTLVATVAFSPGEKATVDPRPVPAPPFASINTASRVEIVAYAKSLTFDTSYHATDTRRLAAERGANRMSEPLVTIAPEIGIVPLSDAELAKGRIVARLTASAASKRYGLAAGDNYLWMEGPRGAMRGFIIPADTSASWKAQAIKVLHKRMNTPATHPQARFRWDDLHQMDSIWTPCGQDCCQICNLNECGPQGPTKPPKP